MPQPGDQGPDAGQSGQRRRRAGRRRGRQPRERRRRRGSRQRTSIPPRRFRWCPRRPRAIEGRVVGIFVGDGVDGAGVATVSKALERAGAQAVVIASHGGTVKGDAGPVVVTKTMLTTQSVEYDALVVAGGASAEVLARDPYMAVNLGEAFRHYKTIAAWGEGNEVLGAVGLPADAPGVVTSAKAQPAVRPESHRGHRMAPPLGAHAGKRGLMSGDGRTPHCPWGVRERSGRVRPRNGATAGAPRRRSHLAAVRGPRRLVGPRPLPRPSRRRPRRCPQHLARSRSAGLRAVRFVRGVGRPQRPGRRWGRWQHRFAVGWRLSGVKPYCSGSDHLDRALVTADAPDGYRLFDISVAEHVVAVAPGSWSAVGMADSVSETLTFGGPVLPESAAVGPPDFYLQRPGFWSGSVGVAACWYGGAKGLVDVLLDALGQQSRGPCLGRRRTGGGHPGRTGRVSRTRGGRHRRRPVRREAPGPATCPLGARSGPRRLSAGVVLGGGGRGCRTSVPRPGPVAARRRSLRLPGPASRGPRCRRTRSDRAGSARMSLIVDADHPGTTEETWSASVRLRELPPVAVPEANRVADRRPPSR